VTTKFGIEPPTGLAGNARAINVLKKILGPFPALLQHAKNRGSAMIKTKSFTPEAAVQSLETSLREMGTDYVDIFLLHEADVADASSSPLVEALLREVAKGKIRHIGIGSAFEKLNEPNRLPAEYKILQFEDNVVDRNVARLSSRDRFLITHSIFVPAQMLLTAVNASPELFHEYSHRIGIDLNDPSTIAALLLRWALWSNANGIVLFSSRNPLHITRNVQEAESAAASHLSDEARLLFAEFANQLVTAEGPSSRGTALRRLGTGASS
jgi:aryl-alcohol dehydrogenase-like predicted oxidoreductase